MTNNDELFIKLEKEFQKKFEVQRNFYERKLELLRSEFDYYKNKMDLELENQVKWAKEEVKSNYDIKSVEDTEKIKSYYESKLEAQKDWYEKEIEKRQKETESWHIANLEKKLSEQKENYERILKNQEETFNTFIEDQKKIYEEQIRPYRKIIRLRNKLENKFERFIKKKEEDIVIQEEISEQEETTQPKVSIIMPVYNVGKYLRQSLDSVVNQTLKDIEIICIDDGSTDDSYDILEEYKEKDSRIKVIHKSNKGTGAARNDGLRLAQGECIGFVDPDDWVKPNMFERLYTEIKEKNLDIAMCLPDGYDEKNNKYAPFPYFVDENFKNVIDNKVFNWKDLSPFRYPMCVWNKLYTKKLLDDNKIEFAQGLDFEDHKVIFGALLTAQRVFFIREKLYVYRYNREGSILTDNNRRLLDHIQIFDIVENILQETNTYEALREDFLTYKIHNLLYYYSMIKPEYKDEYYQKMVKSLKETNLTETEYSRLSTIYPQLKEML